MYEHISLIYNPFAGGLRGAKLKRLDAAERALQTQGRTVTRRSTEGPRTGGKIARECVLSGSDLIVVAGGDGTINEVADGMTASAVPLGVLPAGTANVLANEMRLDRSMERAAQSLADCVPRPVSLGLLTLSDGTMRQFLLMTGAGFDADIIFHLNARWKARLGKAAYWLGSSHLFWRKLEEFEVEAEGARHTCSFALISKVRNYGGDFEIARDVRIWDHEFEVVLFEGANTFRYMKYFAGIAMHRPRAFRGVTVYRTKQVCLTSRGGNPVHCQIDGEYAGSLPVTVTSGQQTLMLLMPRHYLNK